MNFSKSNSFLSNFSQPAKLLVGVLGGLICLNFLPSLAKADVSQENVSVTSDSGISTYDAIREKAELTYVGTYRSAPLNSFSSSMQPTPDGGLDPKSPQSIENFITAGYRISKDLTVGAVGHFYYFPVGNPAGSGHSLQVWDPAIVVNKANMVNRNGFKLAGRILTHLPLTQPDYLVSNHLALAISPTAIATYQVPNTALTLGLFTYLRGYIPTASASNARTYKIYVAPNALYPLGRKVAFTLWVDLIQASRYGRSGLVSGLTNDPVDIEPGINWDITPNISLNPVLNIYPGHLTLAATSVWANLIAKAF